MRGIGAFRHRVAAAAAACGVFLLAPAAAAAQIVPGFLPPANAAEAIDDIHSTLCVLAAAGRPVGGLNIPLIGGEGYTELDRIPDKLVPFVQSGPGLRLIQYEAPGDTIWVVHDPASGRCATYAFGDPTPVEAKLLESLSRPGAWKRRPAADGVDHLFEWAIDKPLRLRTEIRLPDASGEPLAVVVSPFRR